MNASRSSMNGWYILAHIESSFGDGVVTPVLSLLYVRVVHSLIRIFSGNRLGSQEVLGKGGAGGHLEGSGRGGYGGEPGLGPRHRGRDGTWRGEGGGQLLAEQGAGRGAGQADLRGRRRGDSGAGGRLGPRSGPEPHRPDDGEVRPHRRAGQQCRDKHRPHAQEALGE